MSSTRYYSIDPTNVTKVICFVYGIFGFTSPSLQGADILAHTGKEYLVVMLDLFDSKFMQSKWWAQDNEEKKQKIADFRPGLVDPRPHLDRTHDVLLAAKADSASVKKWGAIGCDLFL